jgi:hypothetical protein
MIVYTRRRHGARAGSLWAVTALLHERQIYTAPKRSLWSPRGRWRNRRVDQIMTQSAPCAPQHVACLSDSCMKWFLGQQIVTYCLQCITIISFSSCLPSYSPSDTISFLQYEIQRAESYDVMKNGPYPFLTITFLRSYSECGYRICS